MKVKGQIDVLKRSVDKQINELVETAAKLQPLSEPRATNLTKLVIKLKEWQNK